MKGANGCFYLLALFIRWRPLGVLQSVPTALHNYRDMTGPASAGNRIVNPTLQPLKGYWVVIDDSGQAGRYWNRVSWSNSLPAGCGMEVYVRASDDRLALANEQFLAVSNNVPFTGVNGRYIEVRLALVRDNPAKQPVLYDLTLHGLSTSFEDWFLGHEFVYETQNAEFWPWVFAPEPFSYQWYAFYPWADDWLALSGQTNSTLVLTNVDSWDNTNWFGVVVTIATGESLFVGPALLLVMPTPIFIPTNGPASRYPATIEVFGQPTNRLSRVEVTLDRLTHTRAADLDILLVSPSGTKIMLMSDAGGTNAVYNAALVFHPNWHGWPAPPYRNAIPSHQTSDYRPYNYEGNNDPMPSPAPAGPYSASLDDLPDTDPNPNGIWKLYINDDASGGTGVLENSWNLEFYYP